MSQDRKHLVPVAEVAWRYLYERHSLEVITRDLRSRGLLVSTSTVRNALNDAGVRTDVYKRGSCHEPAKVGRWLPPWALTDYVTHGASVHVMAFSLDSSLDEVRAGLLASGVALRPEDESA
ncbi:hypothetical protein ACFQ6C_26555 [Streptomyces sp. NPDC056454]|uniref:hypothetical protein n=1 Tax=Streptomyces sp. NPDC056454 TaxID=3345823 RepID=UPI003684315B